MVKQVKVIDLFNVKYDEMEGKINSVLSELQGSGKTVEEVRTIGDSLNKCAVFVVYNE